MVFPVAPVNTPAHTGRAYVPHSRCATRTVFLVRPGPCPGQPGSAPSAPRQGSLLKDPSRAASTLRQQGPEGPRQVTTTEPRFLPREESRAQSTSELGPSFSDGNGGQGRRPWQDGPLPTHTPAALTPRGSLGTASGTSRPPHRAAVGAAVPHPRRRPPPPDPSLSLPPRSRPSPRLPPFAPQPRRRMGDRRGAEPRLPAPLFLFSLRRFRAKSERRLRAVGGQLLRHAVRACAWRLPLRAAGPALSVKLWAPRACGGGTRSVDARWGVPECVGPAGATPMAALEPGAPSCQEMAALLWLPSSTHSQSVYSWSRCEVEQWGCSRPGRRPRVPAAPALEGRLSLGSKGTCLLRRPQGERAHRERSANSPGRNSEQLWAGPSAGAWLRAGRAALACGLPWGGVCQATAAVRWQQLASDTARNRSDGWTARNRSATCKDINLCPCGKRSCS